MSVSENFPIFTFSKGFKSPYWKRALQTENPIPFYGSCDPCYYDRLNHNGVVAHLNIRKYINPFKRSELFYPCNLEESICQLRGVWLSLSTNSVDPKGCSDVTFS